MKHFDDLKREVNRYVDRGDPDLPINHNFAADETFEVTEIESDTPIMSILIGEVIYNLRSALDYLIYALSCLDSGSLQEGTQFPIADTPGGFADLRKRGYLRGVNAAHVATIETLQPYNGCGWTKILRTLSNPDKHRQLTPLSGKETFWVSDKTGYQAQAESTAQVKTDYAVTREILFSDGTPVIDTLVHLISEVSNTLTTFLPEFREPNPSG